MKKRLLMVLFIFAAVVSVLVFVFPSDREKPETRAIPESPSPTEVVEESPSAVVVLGKDYDLTETELSFAGMTLSAEDEDKLREELLQLPYLEKVDLRGTGVTEEYILSLLETFPGVYFPWKFTVGETLMDQEAEELDLTGTEVTDLERLILILSDMPKLKKLDLTDCGLDDEELDNLNRRFENIRIVWTLHIGVYNIRTDDVAFRAYYGDDVFLMQENLDRLCYCTDMICMDFGHRYIPNIEFLRSMPHMKYLILLQCSPKDISPLSTLKELVYLELNFVPAESLRPILECTALEDLNISFSNKLSQEEVFEVLKAMPWLHRVWFDWAQIATDDLKTLKAMYPDIVYKGVGQLKDSCIDPWRYGKNYYAMRDLLGMYYMDGYGRKVEYRICNGKRYGLNEEIPEEELLKWK